MSDNYKSMNIFESVLQDNPKYNKVRELDSTQHDPKLVKTIDFKQDYVVMIRKKLYYAASAVSDELYLRVYQINNFTSVRTSQNVFGRPGTCSVSIKGGERVICAEREEQDNKQWSDWKSMLRGWTNIDDEGENDDGLWRVGQSNWTMSGSEGVDFKNLMKSREAKYGWKFAEKADWEPMDEIYVFSKTKNEKLKTAYGGGYEFIPIFFGYIDSVQKTFQAGSGGLLINITASDHLKLLELGKVINYPSLAPGKYSGGGIEIKFPTDAFGCFMINDPLTNIESDSSEATPYLAYQNVFSGKYPYEIINQLAMDSGIPKQYLTKRIEPIKTVPFLPQIRSTQNGDLFNADMKSRIEVCRSAAEKLFLEFFADEEGNIVLKIPNYALGANKLPDNNMGNVFPDDILDNITDIMVEVDESTVSSDDKEDTNNTIKVTDSDNVEKIEYIVKKGDTLTAIASKFLGSARLYTEIHSSNFSVIGDDPNKIYPGQKLIIYKRDTSNDKANKEAIKNISQDSTKNINNQLKSEQKLKVIKGTPLSQKTDHLIPVIKPEHIVSFTLTDTDKEIYNMYEIQAETINNIMQGGGLATIRRAVPDLASIIRFGLRPHPGVTNTPLISSELEAQLFGILMINKSLANRYTGSITIIEESSIKVGDPIRFHMYDEHPMKETGLYNDTNAQSIFYVTGIERSISPNNVSYMTLQLRAGRMMGQESIYDISYLLYKFYYDEKLNLDVTKSLDEFKQYYSDSKTENYKVKSQDTIQKIINEKYGSDVTGKRFEEIIYSIIALNPDLFQGKTISRPEVINEILYNGLELKIPKSGVLR